MMDRQADPHAAPSPGEGSDGVARLRRLLTKTGAALRDAVADEADLLEPGLARVLASLLERAEGELTSPARVRGDPEASSAPEGPRLAAYEQRVEALLRRDQPTEDPDLLAEALGALGEGLEELLAVNTQLSAQREELSATNDRLARMVEELEVANEELRIQQEEILRVQHALSDSEARLREVLNNSRDAVYRRNLLTGTYDYFSPASIELSGYTPEELIAMSTEGALMLIHPDDRDAYRARDRAMAESPDISPSDSVEFRLLTKWGEYRWLSVNRRLVRDADGRPVAHVGTIRDVTERKRAEEEQARLLERLDAERRRAERLARVVEDERDLLEALMEGASAHLAFLDPEFRFVHVNSAYAAGSGYTKEELLGRGHFELFPHEENEAIFRRVRETGEPAVYTAKPFVYPERPELGVTYWDWSLVPLHTKDGTLRGFVFSLADVTEHRRLLEENRSQRLFLETLLRNAPVGIAVVDAADYTFELANPAYRAIAGDSGRPLEGRTIAEAFPEDVARSATERLDRAVATGQLVSVREYPITPAPGGDETYWDVDHAPLRDPGGVVRKVLVLAHDVTQEVVQRRRLAESEERFRVIFERAAVGIVEIGPDGSYLEANAMACRILGRERGEMLALRDPDVTHPDDREREEESVQALWAGRIPSYTLEKRYLAPDGGETWVRVTSSLAHRATGAPYRLAVTEDITARRRAEERVRDVARFPDENPSPILRVRGDGVLLYANRASRPLLEQWGCRVGQPLASEWRQEVAGALDEGQPRSVELAVGDTDYALLLVPVAECGYVNLYTHDVTERQRARKALQAALEELEVANEELRVQQEELLTARDRVAAANEELRAANDELEVANEELLSQRNELLLAERAMSQRLSDLTALYEASQALAGLYEEGELLQRACELGVARFGLELVWIGLAPDGDAGGDGIAPAAVAGTEAKERHRLRAVVPGDERNRPALRALRTGAAVTVTDLAAETEYDTTWREEEVARGRRSVVALPLVCGDRAEGVLVAYSAEPHTFGEERLRTLESLANLAATGLEKARLYQQVRRHAETLEEVVARRTAELRASEARFRAIYEGSAIGIGIIDIDGRVVDANPALQELLGYRNDELRGRHAVEFGAPGAGVEDLVPRFRALASEGDGIGQVETRFVRRDGHVRWGHVTLSFVRDEAERPLFAILMLEDITEGRQAHEALLQAERLNTTGQLAAAFAHEVKNPLQAVIGCLGLLSESLTETERTHQYLEVAREELRRANRIVERFRDLHRAPSGQERRPTRLHDVLEQVLLISYKEQERRHVSSVLEVEEDIPLLLAVPDQLQQVFLNLVLNAVDAMPDGGTLLIRAERAHLPDGVRVHVQDTGTGISKENMARLFEFLFTTKEHGTGLGLFVCRDVVERHGGRISAESQVGVGTTFTVWLPAAPDGAS